MGIRFLVARHTRWDNPYLERRTEMLGKGRSCYRRPVSELARQKRSGNLRGGYFGFALFLRQRLRGEYFLEKKYAYGMGALAAILLLLLFVTGIFLESYVNLIILKNILKFF